MPLETWKDYLAYHFISDHAAYLSKDFDQANFDFYSKTLRDVPTQRDRWKRGVSLVNGALGEAVGQIYVQRHYPPESSRQMGELIGNFRAALQEKIETNGWMDGRPRRRRWPSSRPSIRAPATRPNISTIQASRSTAPTCSAMSCAPSSSTGTCC